MNRRHRSRGQAAGSHRSSNRSASALHRASQGHRRIIRHYIDAQCPKHELRHPNCKRRAQLLSRPSDFRSNPPKGTTDWSSRGLLHGGRLASVAMRVLIGLCTAALALTASPAVADSDSLAQRAQAAADATLAAKISSRQLNATAGFLIPLRISNPRIGGSFGFDVVDTSTGESVYSTRADAALRPASNMKIVTALTALKVLGPDTRMTTETFVPKRGQVILRGRRHHPHEHRSGESGQVHRGVSEVQPPAARKRQPADYRPSTCVINGKTRKSTNKRPCPMVTPPKRRALKVYVDDSLYRTPKRGPGWTSSYQPTIVRPVRSLGRLGVYQWDSAKEAGYVLSAALRSAGIKTRTVGHRDVQDGAASAAKVTGDTVASQVRSMLLVSENNIAEMLFRQVAVERGRKGTWKGGRLAARDTLRELGLSTRS